MEIRRATARPFFLSGLRVAVEMASDVMELGYCVGLMVDGRMLVKMEDDTYFHAELMAVSQILEAATGIDEHLYYAFESVGVDLSDLRRQGGPIHGLLVYPGETIPFPLTCSDISRDVLKKLVMPSDVRDRLARQLMLPLPVRVCRPGPRTRLTRVPANPDGCSDAVPSRPPTAGATAAARASRGGRALAPHV